MGITRTEDYSLQQNTIAVLAKAIGHPARVAILEFLLKTDHCICGDIVNELPLSQPTVSQHLKELKAAGLIKGNISGTSICYCINEKTVTELLNYLQRIKRILGSQSSKCC